MKRFAFFICLILCALSTMANEYTDKLTVTVNGESMEQQAVRKSEYEEIRARMDAEDPRIARAFEAKELFGDPVSKIAADLDVSGPRVYQLIARAKAIGREYRGIK